MAENYYDMVPDLAQSYKSMGCNTSLNMHILKTLT